MDAPVTLRAALVAASLVLVVVGPERSGAAAPAADRFTLGILRRDGLVTPFATFDGKHWNNTWPKPVRHVDEVPVTLGSVPRWWWGRPGPRETWLASIGPAERRELHVTGANVYDAQCLQQIGLRTDYRPSAPLPGPGARPYPKDGLAVSPPYPIEPIEVMPIPTLPRQLVDAFNGSEALALRHAPVEPLKAVLRRRHETVPISIEAAYAVGDPSWRIYYYEAVRRYETTDIERPGECGGMTYGAGWFTRDGNGPLKNLSFEATITSCDRSGLLYMLPLGGVRADGRFFWVAQWSGWNSEQYNIVEIKPNGTEDVLRVFGGGC
jgi:hypothetical protein